MSKQIIELIQHSEPNNDFCNVKIEGKNRCTIPMAAVEAKRFLNIVFDGLVLENIEVRIKE